LTGVVEQKTGPIVQAEWDGRHRCCRGQPFKHERIHDEMLNVGIIV